MKALVGAFNQEKALVGAFSVIVQPVVEPIEHYTALVVTVTSVLTVLAAVRGHVAPDTGGPALSQPLESGARVPGPATARPAPPPPPVLQPPAQISGDVE